MKSAVLVSWIGITDLRASQGELGKELGPIGQAVRGTKYSHVVLLSDHSAEDERAFLKWLKGITTAAQLIHHCNLSSPTNYENIYREALSALSKIDGFVNSKKFKVTYHLSPGTPAMAAVWLLLAKTSHPAELIESSLELGVRTVSFPFDLAADYLPEIENQPDEDLLRLSQGLPPEAPEFVQIIHSCKPMKRLVTKARRIASFETPVLLQGESGTGKELLARAVHAASSRAAKPFVAVNCGAIPVDLVESELFGHQKGAFTGATRDRRGHIEEADGGTLFLDEIGDLTLNSQVKLLRVLQDGKVRPIGSDREKKVDFRLVAASNKSLLYEISQGRFREDLFHRIAVGVLELPPLRQRRGDLGKLIDYALALVNTTGKKQVEWEDKELSAGARNLLHQHPWPGNVRELINTLTRAAIWSTGKLISTEEIREALFPVVPVCDGVEMVLKRNLGNDFSLPDLVQDVASHYLKRALKEANGNKTVAAQLVGLPSYQTLTNWVKKYGVE